MSIKTKAHAALERIEKTVEAVVKDQSFYKSGILYQDDLEQEVMRRLNGEHGVPNLSMGIINVKDHQEALKHERAMVGKPRGTWMVLQQEIPDRVFYRYLMSDGLGGVAGKYDSYDEPPTFEKARDRMVGYEVYCLRRKIEAGIALQGRLDCLKRMDLWVGQEFKNVELYAGGRGKHKFSTVTITAVHEDDGSVDAQARKRGTRNRFNLRGVTPHALERALTMAEKKNAAEEEDLDMPSLNFG